MFGVVLQSRKILNFENIQASKPLNILSENNGEELGVEAN